MKTFDCHYSVEARQDTALHQHFQPKKKGGNSLGPPKKLDNSQFDRYGYFGCFGWWSSLTMVSGIFGCVLRRQPTGYFFWGQVVQKISKRLDSRKGPFYSLGDRITTHLLHDSFLKCQHGLLIR